MNCCSYIPELQSREGCPCDRHEFPPAFAIMAGLKTIPRQVAGFSDFRNAMLANIRTKDPLNRWRAREGDDPGMMLLEMWAYICDSIAFYDEVIANEGYLGTAKQRASVNKLASLLGYLPRPAVASMVSLAAIAEGRQLLKIPAGTAFRSGAFDDNPPQVFETFRDQFVHPFTNRWSIEPPVTGTVYPANPSELLVKPLVGISPGMTLFLVDTGDETQNQVLTVKDAVSYTTANKLVCSRVSFESALSLSATTPLSRLKLTRPTQTARILEIGDDPASGMTNNTVTLDKLYPEIANDEYILVSRGNEFRWFTIKTYGQADVKASPDTTVKVNGSIFTVEGNITRVTKLVLDAEIDFHTASGKYLVKPHAPVAGDVVLHYNLQPAGTILNEPHATLFSTDPLSLSDPVEKPLERFNPENFLLQDKNNIGHALKARAKFEDKKLELNQGEGWKGPLTIPVEVFGNVISATRGETVKQEVLGSGDASLASQTFKLKKKPLTYLFSPSAGNDQGVKSALEIRVNGIIWKETAKFYNVSPADQVFIVRQDEEGESFITFGDGINGQRLPAGKDNVMATYRFGTGLATPPAQSVTQIATPIKGLKNILNPVAAGGGADRETTEESRTAVPKSAMLLGRIVSIRDVEAAVSAVPGVRAIRVEWLWSKTRQAPMMHVFYIGEETIRSLVIQRLNSISDPNITYQVEKATKVPVSITIDLSTDARNDQEMLIAAAHECLMNTVSGLFSPVNIGIGTPVYRSRIYQALTSIEGITGVGEITWNGFPFDRFAISPGPGKYFDVETGGLIIDGINAQP